MFPGEGGKFFLEEVSGLIGHVAGKPFACGLGLLHPGKACKELGARPGNDDLGRFGKEHHLSGHVVAEENSGLGFGHRRRLFLERDPSSACWRLFPLAGRGLAWGQG